MSRQKETEQAEDRITEQASEQKKDAGQIKTAEGSDAEPKKKKRKKWHWVILAIVLAMAVVLVGAGNYLVTYAIVRKENVEDVSPESATSEEDALQVEENMVWIEEQKEEWLAESEVEVVSIVSSDDLTLEGDIILSEEEDSHLWLIAIHGYTGQRSAMYNVAYFYAQEGYNVLTPDMRSHGESEGTYIGMGWLDKEDVLQWIDYIIELDPEAEIVLHGISMGGATVMMVSGEDLPDNVKAIVEDCGYTSVWDIFADELSYLFGLPEFPLMYIANGISGIRAGYTFSEASALVQVAQADVPILFIHGDADTFVSCDMVYEVYEACSSEKELLVIEGAGHGESYKLEPELYFDTVFSFVGQYVNE